MLCLINFVQTEQLKTQDLSWYSSPPLKKKQKNKKTKKKTQQQQILYETLDIDEVVSVFVTIASKKYYILIWITFSSQVAS